MVVTAALAIALNVVAFGVEALTVSGLAPNGLFLLVVLAALVLLRRGHFKLTLWIVIAASLIGQAHNLLTIDLRQNGEALLIFIIPATIAGLLISRRALLVVLAVSVALVVITPIVHQVSAVPDSDSLPPTVVVFLLVLGFYSFMIDVFGSTFRGELAASVARENALEQARQALEARSDELARLNERLDVTLRSIGDAVIATDAEGKIAMMNSVAQQLTGWTSAIGLPLSTVFRIVSENTREPVESPFDKVLCEGNIVGLANHTLLLAKDGRAIPIDDSGAPIRDRGGRMVGVVLVFRDITERRQAEHTLARAFEAERAASRLARLQEITAARSGALTYTASRRKP